MTLRETDTGSAGTPLTVRLDDGRELEVFAAGPDEGTVLILNHGACDGSVSAEMVAPWVGHGGPVAAAMLPVL